jgi:ferrous iron transport protein A
MHKSIVNCTINKAYIIKKLHTTGALRQRLISFGILKGVKIKYLSSTNLQATYEIQVGKMAIALRKEEAMKIEVQEYETN